MNFEQLRQRVERAELLADGRTRQTHASWDALKLHWRQGWTPARIVIAGLVTGFVAGKTQPQASLQRIGKLAGPQTMQIVTSLTGLMSSLQAAKAAFTAKKAAHTADDAAETADDAADTADVAASAAVRSQAASPGAGPSPTASEALAPRDEATTPAHAMPAASPSDRARRPDPSWDAAPGAAEAATDVSEPRR